MENNTVQTDQAIVADRVEWSLVGVFLVTLAADLLFWKVPIGASLGVFVCLMTGAIVGLRLKEPWKRRQWVLLSLLGLSAFQAAVEISLSNVLVLFALLAALVGETYFGSLPTVWARWIEAQCALLIAPFRWFGIFSALTSSDSTRGTYLRRSRAGLWRAIQIGGPAVILTGSFLVLLAGGNAIFANIVTRASEQIISWLGGLDLSAPRILFWIAVGTVSFAWLSPWKVGLAPFLWNRAWPEWRRGDSAIARWQSFAVFAALNGLFFCVNTLDVVYLWAHAKLPEGVSPSAYLHAGVGSLIVAVILSALVLMAIFQQDKATTESPLLRGVAYLWIGQNVLLIAGVVLRLKLYVEAYQWTELRVYVGFFLLLVTFGFATLAWRIARRKTLGWLVITNLYGTFALFFVVQFLNVAGWIAEANVEIWRNDGNRIPDLVYLESLGAPAWPAIARAKDLRPGSTVELRATEILTAQSKAESERLREIDWRSVQFRRDVLGRQLIHRIPTVSK